jgi:hypothetical protein
MPLGASVEGRPVVISNLFSFSELFLAALFA